MRKRSRLVVIAVAWAWLAGYAAPTAETIPTKAIESARALRSPDEWVVSYEWFYITSDEGKSFPPSWETHILRWGSPELAETLRNSYPGTQLDMSTGIPILQRTSANIPSNLDAIITVRMIRPTFADVLLEINRQINCNLIVGRVNKLHVHFPMYVRAWFPDGFLDEAIAEEFVVTNVTARQALATLFRSSKLAARFSYLNATRIDEEGEEVVSMSMLNIAFVDGHRIVSYPEHAMPDHGEVPPWINEDDLLSEEETTAWFRRVSRSNQPGEDCGQNGSTSVN
jgi:hypothetical protein